MSAWAGDFFSLSHILNWSFAAVEPQTGDGFWLAADVVFLVLDALITLCLFVCPAQSHSLPILVLMSLLHI